MVVLNNDKEDSPSATTTMVVARKDDDAVDYAATADAFFNAAESDEDEEEDEKGKDDDDDDEEDSSVNRSGEDDEDSSDSDSSDGDSDEGSGDSPSPSSSSSDGGEDAMDAATRPSNVENSVSRRNNRLENNKGEEPCTFDLRNLLAVNTHPMDSKALYCDDNSSSTNTNKKCQQEEERHLTIPPDLMDVAVNEEYLQQKATEGCTQLVAKLWQLPTKKSDAGIMVSLPCYEEVQIPRAMAPPPPKQETKWEKFAKEKGLPLNKNKRSRKVWDDATQSWMYRTGYQKANDQSKEWPIMEVKGNEDPYEDPWERQRDAKRARTDKNLQNQLRNQERSGVLPKGTTTRVMKNRAGKKQSVGSSSANNNKEKMHKPPPAGIPVDLKATKLRGKDSTMAALAATQRSTASLGKFDKVLEGEPERKKIIRSSKKNRSNESSSKDNNKAGTTVAAEADRSLKLLRSVVEGGGKAKEKARRKGHLSKGETAYDYDFDDGLGPGTFKKKKGRAGTGKAKKMTKKRAK